VRRLTGRFQQRPVRPGHRQLQPVHGDDRAHQPYRFAGQNYQTDITYGGSSEEAGSRTVVFIVSWIAVGVYLLVVWSMYKSMVKNFDMTIRRQSR
jgi:hypothetical protein